MIYADGDNIASAVLSALNERDRDTREHVIATASRSADPDQLVRAVADHANAVRRNAALDALARGGARSVPALVRALDDPDPEVVMFAASVLGKTRDREAIPHLVRLLDHEDVNIVQAAIESLGHLRATAAVTRLAQLLDRDPWLRFGAVHALGEIGDPRATAALGAVLDDDDVWELVVAALGKLRSPAAIGLLAESLLARADSGAFDVPLRALAEALRRQPRTDRLRAVPAWSRLAGDDAAVVQDRLRRILETSSDGFDLELTEAAAMLVRALELRGLYVPLLRAARAPALRPVLHFWTLAVGAGIADALIEGLADPDPGVRTLVCRCAGALRLRPLAEPLAARLADPDPEVREAAVRALTQLGPDSAVVALTERLVDPVTAVRDAAQEALTACDPALTSEALLGLPRRDPPVVEALLRMMRSNPHPNQLPFLFDGLRHELAAIRRLAVEAVAEQPEIDLVGILTPLLDDADEEVRVATIHILGRRRTTRAIDALIERLDQAGGGHAGAGQAGAGQAVAPSDFRLLVTTLLEMDSAAIAPRLVEVYLRAPGPARAPILQALAELREASVEPLLVALLADDEIAQRRFAVEALAGFGSPVALRHLIAAGTDAAWEVRAAVAEVLGKSDAPAATAELERLCFDEHRVVATTARHHLECMHVD